VLFDPCQEVKNVKLRCQNREIEFGCVMNAAGARNFYGEPDAYWFQPLLKPLGLDYTDCTLVTASVTVEPYEGVMPLNKRDTRPLELYPECIKILPLQSAVLNKKNLSNPGASAVFMARHLQSRKQPFIVSFAAIGPSLADRVAEAKQFRQVTSAHLQDFEAPFAIELNLSYPGFVPEQGLEAEVYELCDVLSELKLPLGVKLCATASLAEVRDATSHPACAFITLSNAIPYGSFSDEIDWPKLFGSEVSPLELVGLQPGGGALSGRPLFHLVRNWIKGAREYGLDLPIIGCGGILSIEDARDMMEAGANAIALGSVSLLRPTRVRRIVRFMDEFWGSRPRASVVVAP
jgi:dihydroorotate dehydrogenase